MAKIEQFQPLRQGPAREQGPAAVITRRAADRLRAGHLWVYRTDIEQILPGSEPLFPGALVTVLDGRGTPLGSALFSAASQITLRLISRRPDTTRADYLATVRERVAAALNLRVHLSPLSPENNACRLLFSEADNLSGIVADRYNDLVILQLLTQGTAQDDVRQVLTEAFSTLPGVVTLVERPDPKVRELEQLPPIAGSGILAGGEDASLTSLFTINGLRFHFDATSGQKTGAFLDQRLNYQAAANHSHGRALDICTYQGGFALHLARVCERVTGVDASRAALEVADRNLLLNEDLTAKTDWIEADAFDLLREFEAAGERYDTVVLDPPAFAKSKRALESAMRGYKELNLRALKMLRPGGTLVTCSCSQHFSLADFTAVLAEAAADTHLRVQVLETRGAAPDHPAILALPETAYLKCLICRVM